MQDRPITPDSSADLAHRIAERLFTNGANQRAGRLVLEMVGGHDGGGWCYDAVVAQIVDELNALEARR